MQRRPPATEGWRPHTVRSLLPKGLGAGGGGTAASFLPLRDTPDNQSRPPPSTAARPVTGSLKVNGLELWSQIQVMTDFSNSGVTDLLVPLALSLYVLPTEIQGTTGLPDPPVRPALVLGSQPCQGPRTSCLSPLIHTLQGGGPSELLEHR